MFSATLLFKVVYPRFEQKVFSSFGLHHSTAIFLTTMCLGG